MSNWSVDLGERLPVKRIAACFMQGFYADIWMPRAVEISVSDDDRHYTPLAAVENDIPFEYKQDCYREFGWSGQTAARYVRLKALHNGHPGGWIFTGRDYRGVTPRGGPSPDRPSPDCPSPPRFVPERGCLTSPFLRFHPCRSSLRQG